MNIIQKLTEFVWQVFKTNLEIFLEALKQSPNAQGYVSGSISELLLKKELEDKYSFEVKRIREKWEGKKHSNHHGDFYIRRNGSNKWFVMESKGVKSNSEKWHKLYNYQNLVNFLYSHSDKIGWLDKTKKNIEEQIIKWIDDNLPKFKDEYSSNLYEYEEVQKYLQKPPSRETEKSKAIKSLSGYNRDEINALIDVRLKYVMSKVKVLETHFVSGTSGSSERTQATPRKDEFNAISIDIFLRYGEHKFLYANPRHLESSSDDPNHLQQNYIMGFVFIDNKGKECLHLSDEWAYDFEDVVKTIDEQDAVQEGDMQIDNRNFVVNEDSLASNISA